GRGQVPAAVATERQADRHQGGGHRREGEGHAPEELLPIADVLQTEPLAEANLRQEFADLEVARTPGPDLEVLGPLRQGELEPLHLLAIGPLAPPEKRDGGVAELPAALERRHGGGVDAAHQGEAVVELVERDVPESAVRAFAEVVDPLPAAEPLRLLEVGADVLWPPEIADLDLLRASRGVHRHRLVQDEKAQAGEGDGEEEGRDQPPGS